jgi:hypothetical protein
MILLNKLRKNYREDFKMDTIAEPQGIEFFNVKSGESHFLKTEPQIQAYINSSDMGINASRDQDFGWKLGAEWVKRVRAFRRDTTQMQILTSRNGGQKPTTVQILYFLYGEELRAYEEVVEENENPFEEQYQRAISGRSSQVAPKADDDEDISDLMEISEEDLEPGETDLTIGVDLAKQGADKSVATKATTQKQK